MLELKPYIWIASIYMYGLTIVNLCREAIFSDLSIIKKWIMRVTHNSINFHLTWEWRELNGTTATRVKLMFTLNLFNTYRTNLSSNSKLVSLTLPLPSTKNTISFFSTLCNDLSVIVRFPTVSSLVRMSLIWSRASVIDVQFTHAKSINWTIIKKAPNPISFMNLMIMIFMHKTTDRRSYFNCKIAKYCHVNYNRNAPLINEYTFDFVLTIQKPF